LIRVRKDTHRQMRIAHFYFFTQESELCMLSAFCRSCAIALQRLFCEQKHCLGRCSCSSFFLTNGPGDALFGAYLRDQYLPGGIMITSCFTAQSSLGNLLKCRTQVFFRHSLLLHYFSLLDHFFFFLSITERMRIRMKCTSNLGFKCRSRASKKIFAAEIKVRKP